MNIFGGGQLQQLISWFHVAIDYVIAGGLIALGVYVTLYWQHRFARVVGMMLLGAGIGWGCFAYGRTIGGADCYRQWALANKQAKIDAENRDIAMAKLAREVAEQQRQELAKENFDLQKKLRDYDVWIATNISKSKAVCRLATPDDVRRLHDIWPATPSRKGAK